jgi:hypothetical protein
VAVPFWLEFFITIVEIVERLTGTYLRPRVDIPFAAVATDLGTVEIFKRHIQQEEGGRLMMRLHNVDQFIKISATVHGGVKSPQRTVTARLDHAEPCDARC